MNERTKANLNRISELASFSSDNSKVCPKCGKFYLNGDLCPECDTHGAYESDKVDSGLFVPKNAEKQEFDIYGNEAPHPSKKFSRLIYDFRELITDDSRGKASKKKYDGKSKQEVFNILIQRLGNFKHEFDKRFLRETVLKAVPLTDSLNSKMGKYLRNCPEVEKAKNNGVYYNNLYIIKSSQIEGRKIVHEGSPEKSNSPFGCVGDDTAKYIIEKRDGVISPAPHERRNTVYKDNYGNRVPKKVHEKEDVETKEESWHGYSTKGLNGELFPKEELERPNLSGLF